LVSSSVLVVYSDTQILAFENKGKKLWDQNIVYGSPVSISEGKVYFREASSKAKKLSAVLLDGTEVTDKMIILNSHEDAYPIYLEPLPDGLIAMCTYRVGVEDGTPKTVFYKKTYSSLNYSWVSSFTGDMRLSPLHIRDSNRFIVTTENEIWVYNSSPSDIEEELFRYPHPLPQLLQASASENDILYIMGIEENQLILAAISIEGEEIWRFAGFLDTGFIKQLIPPILGPDGFIHITIGNALSTIRDGKLARRFTSQTGNISYGTALADDSILLVTESTLLQIDSSGEVILEVIFEEPLVTPPVVDKDGKIYVASSHMIYKIS
jgi:outer membrane protein assembly factor BamB